VQQVTQHLFAERARARACIDPSARCAFSVSVAFSIYARSAIGKHRRKILRTFSAEKA